ncbi:TVP38/TMEM64 family protein [Candidatus Kaiserbacteria bacterium]|nr:TVP38/TMEM64 family protein [Candidatus Kaiserbacteria bacterium]
MFESVQAFLETYTTAAPVAAILIRIWSVIIPPIPSTALDAVFLAVFGKWNGFIYTIIGSMIGSTANFFIARKFREPAVRRFMALEKIRAWEEKIRTQTGLLGLISVRVATVLIFDYISYIAGLTKISYGKFLATTFLTNAVFVGLFYYFGGIIIEHKSYWAIIFLLPIAILFVLLRRGRIFRRFQGYVNIEGPVETDNLPSPDGK